MSDDIYDPSESNFSALPTPDIFGDKASEFLNYVQSWDFTSHHRSNPPLYDCALRDGDRLKLKEMTNWYRGCERSIERSGSKWKIGECVGGYRYQSMDIKAKGRHAEIVALFAVERF